MASFKSYLTVSSIRMKLLRWSKQAHQISSLTSFANTLAVNTRWPNRNSKSYWRKVLGESQVILVLRYSLRAHSCLKHNSLKPKQISFSRVITNLVASPRSPLISKTTVCWSVLVAPNQSAYRNSLRWVVAIIRLIRQLWSHRQGLGPR